MSCKPILRVKSLPSTLDPVLEDKVQVCDDIHAYIQGDGIMIHALHDKLPSCTLKSGTDTADDIFPGSICKVYCAQETCGGALEYMNNHVEDFSKCDTILYLHEGAIKIDNSFLSDGDACKHMIHEYNAQQLA